MNVNFGGHQFQLHPSGVLFWPGQSTLVVSDLHLEKGSHMARKGFFLPPYDSHETLVRLHEVCLALSPRKIIFLGDSFHDAQGYTRLAREERRLFESLRVFDPVWIIGNHDKDFVPEGFQPYDEYVSEGITFRHEAVKGCPYEISGHYHPKAEIIHKGAFIARPCFIEDGMKLIMPSFGTYTGGLSVKDAAIATLLQAEARIYALGKDKVYAFQVA